MATILDFRKSVEWENSISCETPLEYCRSTIKLNEQGEKVITFVDNGFSSGNINRDGFRRRMELVQQERVRTWSISWTGSAAPCQTS